MFTKIKEFLFGKDPVQSPVAAPYKIETPTPVIETQPEVVPVVEAKAPAKKKAVAPKAEAKPKAPAKPRAPRNTTAK